MIETMNQRMNESMEDWLNESFNQWLNESMNQWMNQSIKQSSRTGDLINFSNRGNFLWLNVN